MNCKCENCLHCGHSRVKYCHRHHSLTSYDNSCPSWAARDIYAPSINGGEEFLRFEYSPETGLYHWHGNTDYAGYTAEELEERKW